jgi:SWI/SNF-related matrix-associated actin-dependent regulator 1 of chromatin subfamily A
MILRPYQIVGRDFLASRRHAMLADQMRVGKTPQAIVAADAIEAKRVLVACPAIACEHWRNEWATWSPHREPAQIFTRTPPGKDFEGVAIMSYARLVQHIDALRDTRRWDAFIPDEAHFAKSPSAQRTRAVYGTTGAGWNADRIWPLTGTPSPNHAGEIWPMLRAFGIVKVDYDAFVRYFCYTDETGKPRGNKRAHLEELRALIKPYILRRTRKEVAPDMPEISYNFLAFAQQNMDLLSDDPNEVTAENRIAVANAKVPDLAEEILENLEGGEYSSTVVFGYHVEPLKKLQNWLYDSGVNVRLLTGETPQARRQEILAGFRMGAVQVIGAQILAAGTAVDMSAASHGYFLELDFVPGNNEQAASRLISLQKDEPVTMDICTWPGTVDDGVQRTIIRKVKTAVFK